MTRYLAIGLFREGREKVTASKSGLDVHNRNSVVKRSDGSGGGRCRVALDNNSVRLIHGEELVQTINGAGHDGGEGLTLLQDIEVMVRHDAKKFIDLVQHFAVLARDCHDTIEKLRSVQCGNYRVPS